MTTDMPADIISQEPVDSQKRGASTLFSRLSGGFYALRIRNYRLFIFGQIVSLTGSWMQTTAESWLVLKLTNSPLVLGTMTTLQFLPVMLLALYGGVLADHLPKRRTLIVTQCLFLVQASIFGLLVASNSIQLWQVYLLAIFQGIVNAIDMPVRQAFVAEMVGRDDLVNAVALNSMTFNTARIVGPAVGGLLLANIGVAPTLFFNAFSYIAAIIALALMNEAALFIPERIHKVQEPVIQQVKEGLSYAWRTPNILVVFILVAAIGTFGYNFTVTLPLIAEFILKTDAQGFGALSSFLGVGSLVAAFGSVYIKQITMRRLFLSAGAFSILLGITAMVPNFWLSAVLLAALGAAAIFFSTGTNSLLQLLAPDALRGRVMSINVLLIVGSTPIGALLIGWFSEHFGVPITLFVCAVLCAIGVCVGLYYHQRYLKPLAVNAEQ
jgi:MFS family permease